jgi:hypothetical protein
VIGVDDHLVPALMALDRERPHAVLAHVGEVHRLDRIVEAGAGHWSKALCAGIGRMASATQIAPNILHGM